LKQIKILAWAQKKKILCKKRSKRGEVKKGEEAKTHGNSQNLMEKRKRNSKGNWDT